MYAHAVLQFYIFKEIMYDFIWNNYAVKRSVSIAGAEFA
jgi:hypothetical protein